MSRKHSAGKGDARRPYDMKKYHEGWERVFGNKRKDGAEDLTFTPNNHKINEEKESRG